MRDPKIRAFFEPIGYPKEWIEEYTTFNLEWIEEPPLPLPNKSISDKTALACLDKEIKLNDLSVRFANILQSMDVMKGDRVFPTLYSTTVAFFAITMIEAICVPNNVMYTPRELEYQSNDNGAKVPEVSRS